MYQIRCDGDILHDNREDTLTVYNPKLNLEVNKAGGLSFTIYDSHPYFKSIQKLKSIVEVFKNGKVIFKGRVMSDSQRFNKEKNIECEGKLACFNDSVFRSFDFKGSPTLLWEQVLDNHNKQVSDFQKFKMGVMSVSDPNDYINRSSESNLNSWEVLTTRLVDTLGGYLVVRYEADGDYLDYIEDFPHTATQSIQFGENLLNLDKEVNAEETYTAMIPMGVEIEGKRIDISSVNNGLDYIINEDAAKKYGIIYAPADISTWDDVTLPSNLLSKAKEYLNNIGISMSATIELTAIDLNLTDSEIESFNHCDYINIVSEPHGIHQKHLLKKLDIDIANPQNTKITLGDSKRTLTDLQLGVTKREGDLSNRVTLIEKDYVTGGNIDKIVEDTATEKITEIMDDFVSSSVLAGDNVEVVVNQDKTLTVSAIIPKKISVFANDSKYQTEENVLNAIAGVSPPTGTDGFSPTVVEKTNTDNEYILIVTDKSGSYNTPNLKGSSGEKGLDGVSATVSIGNVSTGMAGSQATVTNSGTDCAAIFNFTIPQGAKGDKGDAGSGESGSNSTMYTFEIGTDGHLYLYYADGTQPPNIYIDSNGHLVYGIGE